MKSPSEPVSVSNTDSQALTDIVIETLFNDRDASLSEAIRLKQAEAVSAVAGVEWGAIKKDVLRGKVDKVIGGEKAGGVRGELERAREKLGQ